MEFMDEKAQWWFIMTVRPEQFAKLNADIVRTIDDLLRSLGPLVQHEWDGVVDENRYTSLISISIARADDPDSVSAATEHVLADMLEKIAGRNSLHCDPASGHYIRKHIFWRIKPELMILPWHRVVEYRADGPDRDMVMDMPCVMDRRWLKVGCLARVAWELPAVKEIVA